MSSLAPRRACIIRQLPYLQDLLVRREAEALRDDGFKVHVICLRLPDDQAEEVVEGVRVHRLTVTQRKGSAALYVFKYVLFFLLAAIRVTALHLRERLSVIQVNTMPDFLVFATLIPRLTGARVTLFMYEPMPELWQTLYHRRRMAVLLEVIQRWAIRYAHAVFAVTEQQKETFVARGADPTKITVVLNAPEPRFLQQAATSVGTDPGMAARKEHFALICHGAIEERYGHDTMLRAIDLVKGQIPTVRLHILGMGSYRDHFVAQIKEMGLERWVQCLDWVPLQQMVEELRNADVGIVAQKSSPYSNLVHTGKMYDFLAFGKPVLASRLRSVQAYFGEEGLCYFEPGNPQSLADAILDLYRHPDKRRTLVENSQRLYSQYQWTKQKQAYLAVYRSLGI
jgi:glycosyltransferase involved in cell wall biosynthesis